VHILLSNDDGIQAEGLRRLKVGLAEAIPGVRLTIVAPDREQSASSHALTLTAPLRIHEHGKGEYAVTGTPTDCVLIAVQDLLADDRPDIVISGINHGPNMGEDIHYSGTVAAAVEGSILDSPSLAISLGSRGREPEEWEAADHFVRTTLPGWLARPWPHRTLLNVNVPAGPIDGVSGLRIAKLGTRVYEDVITRKVDPRGHDYYWIGGDPVSDSSDENSDFGMHRQGYITVTPLHLDLTDYKAMVELEDLQEYWSP